MVWWGSMMKSMGVGSDHLRTATYWLGFDLRGERRTVAVADTRDLEVYGN